MANESTNKNYMILGIGIAVLVLIIIIIALLVFTGMNTGSKNIEQNPSTTGQETAYKTEDIVKTDNSNLGEILINKNKMTLYIFMADTAGVSNCYGSCAVNWPPLIIENEYRPVGEDVSGVIGKIKRKDGTTQVTINGMPLYTYIKDINRGDTKGQGVNAAGGLWYAVSPSGQVITRTQTTSSSPNTGGYYGSGSDSDGSSGGSGSYRSSY